MAEDPVLTWQLTDPAGTRVCRLDDEAIVFNPSSWETHLLNFVASEVIEALATGPKDMSELSASVAGEDSSAADLEETRHAIEPVVEHLQSLGLVRPTRSGP